MAIRVSALFSYLNLSAFVTSPRYVSSILSMKHSLKTQLAAMVMGSLGIAHGICLHADPLLDSWLTQTSGLYARIYQNIEDMHDGHSVTTWSGGQGTQSLPVYAGVNEVAYSANWVYIKTTGLGFHIMGPWYLDEAKTQLFPNFPANTATLYRFPRNPVLPDTKTATAPGPIGFFVDGIAMFDSSDTFSYDTSSGQDQTPVNNSTGDGVWNRDAFINERVTFDNANAHQAGALHHYHASPPALRHALGDSVTYIAETNVYSETFNGNHSPIIGWVKDGLPVYGPYGYHDPTPGSTDQTIRRMISGYQLRDGSHGSTDLRRAGRKSLPVWVQKLDGRSTVLNATQYGPDVDARIGGETYSLGRYFEDYAYKGDLGLTQGVDFDLNAYNVRFTRTPEFPEGTWAYFTCILEDGTPTFPYNIATRFFAQPTGSAQTDYEPTVTLHFTGGSGTQERPSSISHEAETLMITWKVIEGATYRMETSTDLESWDPLDDVIHKATSTEWIMAVTAPEGLRSQFFRILRTDLDPYDESPFGSGNTGGGPGGNPPTGPGGGRPPGTP